MGGNGKSVHRSLLLLFIIAGCSFFHEASCTNTTLAPTAAKPRPTLSPASQLALKLIYGCLRDRTKYRFDLVNKTLCSVSYTLICWPQIEADKYISIQCPHMFFAPDKNVTRKCYKNGTWEKISLSRVCNPLPADVAQRNFLKLLAFYNITVPTNAPVVDKHLQRQILIFVIMEWISFSIMVPSLLLLFIFPNFNDDRMNLHRCLVFSFLMSVVTFLPEYYLSLAIKNPRACNALWILNRLFAVSEVTWMFNEGVFLLKTIMFVFSQKSYMWAFFLFGWGFPIVLTLLIWTPVMYSKFQNIATKCWTHEAQNNLMLIIYVPMTIMLVANLIILVYVIGVVISKLKQQNSVDLQSSRKAAKGAIVLMPLLGIIYLMIFYAPQGILWYDYMLVIVQPLQGILVCIGHVFLNKDIHALIKSKWRKSAGNTFMFQSTRSFYGNGDKMTTQTKRRSQRRSTTTSRKTVLDASVLAPSRRSSRKVAPLLNNNDASEEGSPKVPKRASESQPRISFADVSNLTWTPPPVNKATKANSIQQVEVAMNDERNKGAPHSLQSAIIVEESRVSVTTEMTGEQERKMNRNGISPTIFSQEMALERETEMNEAEATPVDIV